MGEIKNLLKNIVKSKNLKLTPKREEILRIFIESDKKHLSAKDIFFMIKKRNISIGLTTIYRTLDLFVEKGIVNKRDFDDISVKYEFIYKKEDRKHHHLICKNCGKVIEISGLLPDDLKELLLEEKGFQAVDFCLKIYGYCKECRDINCDG